MSEYLIPILIVFTVAAWTAAVYLNIELILYRDYDTPRERSYKSRSILLLLAWPIGLVVLFVGSLVILIREAFFNHD